MKTIRADDVPAEDVCMEGAAGVRMRVVVGPDDGAGHFVMRVFEVAAGGHTPLHQHPFEHGVYILGGAGALVTEEGDRPLRAGDVVCVPPSVTHRFRNEGDDCLKFICVIPAQT